MALQLHQFPFSHYNEKARWALAYKGLACERINYLPGPHMPAIRKISGTTQTPVLCDGDAVIAGSSDILRHLEAKCPSPILFPTEPEAAAAVEAELRYFDEDVGPATRTLLFAEMINHGGYLTGMFSMGKSPLKRGVYRAMFPLVKGLMAKGNGVNPENIARSENITAAAMARVLERTQATGYLVGASFTAADLCAAALLAPLASLEHVDMKRPRPLPASLARFFERYASEPALQWVKLMYERHRP